MDGARTDWAQKLQCAIKKMDSGKGTHKGIGVPPSYHPDAQEIGLIGPTQGRYEGKGIHLFSRAKSSVGLGEINEENNKQKHHMRKKEKHTSKLRQKTKKRGGSSLGKLLASMGVENANQRATTLYYDKEKKGGKTTMRIRNGEKNN